MKSLFKYWNIQFKTQLQYKLSFILTFLAQFFGFFTFYFVIYALFAKFGNLKEFNFYEVLLCFSVIQIGFSISEMFARGFDHFEKFIINGTFDRLLMRPQNIYLQVLGSLVAWDKLGRLIQAVIILFIALANLNISFNMLNVTTLILMMIGSTSIFFGIFILGAAFCFVTIQGLEARNIFTDGGRQMAQYPMGIYPKQFLYFFTFIIPFACVNYYPLLYLLGKTNNIVYCFLPLSGVLFIIPCVLVFNRGAKRYCSTGS